MLAFQTIQQMSDGNICTFKWLTRQRLYRNHTRILECFKHSFHISSAHRIIAYTYIKCTETVLQFSSKELCQNTYKYVHSSFLAFFFVVCDRSPFLCIDKNIVVCLFHPKIGYLWSMHIYIRALFWCHFWNK